MKTSMINIRKTGIVMLLAISAAACNKFTDRPPLSSITPDQFLLREADLAAYTVARYNFPTHGGWGPGTFSIDNHTDNQASSGASTRWVPGEWRVPQDGGSWNFGNIRHLNYYLETVVPRWKAGTLTGTASAIDHYVGEGYFLRAYEYFDKVQAYGDYPIIRQTLPDVKELLVEASKRRPRNEVARFILSDLDSAISLLGVSAPQGAKNRLNKYAALLFKSRVALHEATWLKYHKGTAQVPGGANWPGNGKVENFSINIDAEISHFLTEAMDASAEVADAIQLVNNTKEDGYNSSANPYFTMFGDINAGKYSEVLLWRAYDATKTINHNVNHYVNQNGGNTGFTRGLVDNFLMANGLPIYAVGSGYEGDEYVNDVKAGRDNRLQLFMKVPGDLRFTDKMAGGNPIVEGNPDIIGLAETRYVTGYALKKGMSYLSAQAEGNVGSTGSIVFRAAEAYLNYIEASYLKEGTINSKADQYWKALRSRAGINPDYMITVAATDMNKEALNDFGAYSAAQILSDPILYNIRRERRSELIAEGLRYFDLKRWRSMDQLKTSPYIIEGFRLWGPMQDWYKDATGQSRLIEAGTPGKTANVSLKAESNYLRPYRVNLTSSNFWVDGYKWAYAHYLEPIAINHFLQSALTEGDLNSSVIYQNPGWPMEANMGALE